jgi:hypothetical protein
MRLPHCSLLHRYSDASNLETEHLQTINSNATFENGERQKI